MPVLPSALPALLSISGSGGSLFSTSGFRWDYALNDLPFLSGASRQYPIVRETAQVRKQQFDISGQPGENSLEGWWLRSQSSFHGGAGLTFLDVDEANVDTNFIRFHSSRNVDVWEQGKVTLLPDTVVHSRTGVVDGTEVTLGDGSQYACYINATNIIFADTSTSTQYAPAHGTHYALTTDGAYLYLATSTGIWAAPIPATLSAPVWAQEYTAVATNGALAFVKSRIMYGLDNKVYEIPPHPGGAPVALPAAKYTHPDTAWRWLNFTELGNAVYAVGNNTRRGSIIKFVLDNTTGALPTLSAGNVAAQLPAGEVVYSAQGYIGAFMGIGTDRGVRIAVADSNGDLTYGPLLFGVSSPVRAWSARDRFLFAGVAAGIDGDSGIYRIDLSTQVGDLRFAYSTDLNFPTDTGAVEAVCHVGNTDNYSYATATAIYVTHATNLASSGYLRTARVRFGTLESKHFRLFKLRGPTLLGAISVEPLDSNDVAGASYTYGPTEAPTADVNIPLTPQDFLSLKVTFNRGSVVTTGGEMWGYQLKALPASVRSRMIQLPLLCYDSERDKLGNKRGGTGTAAARLFALEAMEQDGTPVQLQDYTTGESVSCVVEQVRFVQDEPPSGKPGFGGLILATLRTL